MALPKHGCMWCHRMNLRKVVSAGLWLKFQNVQVAFSLTDNLPLRQNLCMRQLILRLAFLGVVHGEQEVSPFDAKKRWNMAEVSLCNFRHRSGTCPRMLLKFAAIDWRRPCASNKGRQFTQWRGNLSWSVISWSVKSCDGKMTWTFEACCSFGPAISLWSLSLHYRVCSVWCGKIAEGLTFQQQTSKWFVGQLLPCYVSSSHRDLCCSAWFSMRYHPSLPTSFDTQAFGKRLPFLQDLQ